MSVLGEALAGEHLFHHKGRTYSVSLVTQKVKLDFERCLFLRARESAKVLRECMSDPEYAAHLKALNDDYIEGRYALESERGLSAMKTPAGIKLLASLLFGCSEDEMLGLLCECQEEVASLLALVVKESFPVVDASKKKVKPILSAGK